MSYRLFGAETSAYSTKMRSYLRYKGVEHQWLVRNQDTEEELRTLSKFPTLPVLVIGNGFAVHDTTPMMEALEADRPEPSAMPADPAIAFLAFVLEEYADIWVSKAVYHYRWTRKRDQRIAAQRVVEEYYTTPPEDRKAVEDAAIVRMLGEIKRVGLDEEMGGVIEKSFKRLLKLLNDHLSKHLCLFGGRPSIADFALAGQLIQMRKDPTPARLIEKDAPFVTAWCDFMESPKAGGPFESLASLSDTLLPLFADELSVAFLPWAAENLESSLAGAERFEVTLGRDKVAGEPLRSAARSFKDLRKRFVTAQTIQELRAFTDAAGATVALQRPSMAAKSAPPAEVAVGTAPADGADVATEPASEEAAPARRRRQRRPRAGAADASVEEIEAAAEADASEHAPNVEAEAVDAALTALAPPEGPEATLDAPIMTGPLPPGDEAP